MLAFHGKIVHIQRVNKVRQQSFRNRLTYLKYYWEILKGDLSRALMSENKKAQEAAKQLSIKIFGVREETRDLFLNWYVQYTREVYIIKFMNWRCRKMKFLDQPFTFRNWDPNQMMDHIRWLEGKLCEDLENYGLETLVKAIQQGNYHKNGMSLTNLSLKDIKVDKDLRIVKLEEADLVRVADTDVITEDPGACPPFMFIPTQVQLMKILLKAAYYTGSYSPFVAVTDKSE